MTTAKINASPDPIPWLHRNWPALWGVMTAASAVTLWLVFGADLFTQSYWYAWVLIPVAWAHEFEEYFIGHFWSWYNRTCFKSKEDYFPLTHKRAFLINGSSVIPLLLQAFLVEEFPALTLFMLLSLHANAWFHVTYSVGEGRYSPGAWTSLLLYLPLTTYAIYDMVVVTETISIVGLIVALLVAILAGFGLFGYLRRVAQAKPERLYQTEF